MNTNIELKELQEYLADKTISIVGSGTCIENQEWGKEIDSHDVVIRINQSFRNTTWLDESKQKYVGKRTDIYIANGDTDVKRKWAVKAVGKYKVKYVLRLNPGAHGSASCSRLQSLLLKEVKNVYMAWDFRNELRKMINKEFNSKNPASGAILIKWLTSNIKFKSISLYGFDFFNEFKNITRWGPGGGGGNRIRYGKQNKFWNDYQSSWRGCHDVEEEKKFFRRYIDKYNITHKI